jgi:hypothetical protein
MSELDDVKSEPHRIFEGLANLLRVRAAQEAFGPWQGFHPIDVGPDAFAFVRGNSSSRRILCIHEVAGKVSEVHSAARTGSATDLLGRESVDLAQIQMAPYQSRWIALEPSD